MLLLSGGETASHPFLLAESIGACSIVAVAPQVQERADDAIREFISAADTYSVARTVASPADASIDPNGPLPIPVAAWSTTSELLAELANHPELVELAELTSLWRQAFQLTTTVRKHVLSAHARLEVDVQLRKWRSAAASSRESERIRMEELARIGRLDRFDRQMEEVRARVEHIRMEYSREQSLFRDRVLAQTVNGIGSEVAKISAESLEFVSDIGEKCDWTRFSARPKFVPGSLPGHVYLSPSLFEKLRATSRSIASHAAADVLARLSVDLDAVATSPLPLPARVNRQKLIDQAVSKSSQYVIQLGRASYAKKSIWSHLTSIRGLMMGVLGLVSLTTIGTRFGFGNVLSKVSKDILEFVFYTLLVIIVIFACLNERESRKREHGTTRKFLLGAQEAALTALSGELSRFVAHLEAAVTELLDRYLQELEYHVKSTRAEFEKRGSPRDSVRPSNESPRMRGRLTEEGRRLSAFKSEEEQIRSSFLNRLKAVSKNPKTSVASPLRSSGI